ncbi:MAG: hypothetical protein KJ062_14130 [Thermoanaerobaculia bacterium]|nr:hypothetical protein [Thermoanaerobaculia bacterium]
MGARRPPAAYAVAVFLAVAVSLLGVQLFLAGAAAACGPTDSSCCCSPESPAGDGCGCTVSQATPAPAAVLAAAEGVPAPALVAAGAKVGGEFPVVRARSASCPTPRARSAPTQALLETFRN